MDAFILQLVQTLSQTEKLKYKLADTIKLVHHGVNACTFE